MARISAQRVSSDGWFLKTTDGKEMLLTPQDCQMLLTSVNGDMAAYDTAVKNHAVSSLGSDNVDPSELALTYNLNGSIKSSTIVTNG